MLTAYILLMVLPVIKALSYVHQLARTAPYILRNGNLRIIARTSYDGTGFHGFQEQDPTIRTVQGTISATLSRRFSRSVKATGASRTDIGVHAQGQTIHFDLEPGLLEDFRSFEYKLNQMLPPDIRVYNVTYAPVGTPEQESLNECFHATKSALGKLYVYRFCTNQYVFPLKRQQYAHFYRPVDIDILRNCLKHFEGTHDFSAFANRLEKTAKEYEEKGRRAEFSTERTIRSANLIDEGDGYYRIEFVISSALYRMIRNIVGTSAYVAMGRMDETAMLSLLHNGKSRHENVAKSAVPHGLCLEKVYYDNY